MRFRQYLLKFLYPVFITVKKTGRSGLMLHNKNQVKPPVPFQSLSIHLNDGSILDFETLKGRKVLIVNTASDCGYTEQYAELQELYDRSAGELIIIAFPANDFKEQEKGSDAEIAEFCKVNFGLSFPIATKSSVIKGSRQNAVFDWLTHIEKNGWNNQQPQWNFSKYLLNEEGILTHYFGPAASPLSIEFAHAIADKYQ